MNASSTAPKSFCFVLMPFDHSFNDIYEFGIKGACSDVGVYCERVDEQIFLGSMLDRIYNQISRADLLVADMTGRNPNVFYEVGYAHALGKNVILLTQKSEDIPFDLKHFPHIVYGTQIKDLRIELARRVKHFAFTAPKTIQSQIGIDLYIGKQPLASENIVQKYRSSIIPGANVTIHNSSLLTYAPGDFQMGIIAPPPYGSQRSDIVSVTELPDGNYLHMLPVFETLFPGAHCSAKFNLETNNNNNYLADFNIVIRIFSINGYRDFPLRLQKEI
jgi:hypothetical protein